MDSFWDTEIKDINQVTVTLCLCLKTVLSVCSINAILHPQERDRQRERESVVLCVMTKNNRDTQISGELPSSLSDKSGCLFVSHSKSSFITTVCRAVLVVLNWRHSQRAPGGRVTSTVRARVGRGEWTGSESNSTPLSFPLASHHHLFTASQLYSFNLKF